MEKSIVRNLSEASNALSLAWDRQIVAVVGHLLVLSLATLNFAAQKMWFASLACAAIFAVLFFIYYRLLPGITLVRPRWRWTTLAISTLMVGAILGVPQLYLYEFKPSGIFDWLYIPSAFQYNLIAQHPHFSLIWALSFGFCFAVWYITALGVVEPFGVTDIPESQPDNNKRQVLEENSVTAQSLVTSDLRDLRGPPTSKRMRKLGLFRTLQLTTRLLVLALFALFPVVLTFGALWYFDYDSIRLENGKITLDYVNIFLSIKGLLLIAGLYASGVLLLIFGLTRSENRLAAADLNYYLARQSFDAARQDDSRRPVLFLRSFKDDSISVETKNLFRRLALGRLRLEEVVTAALSKVGVPVAIDPVGKKAMLAGAFRAFHTDDTWQEAFSRLLDQSQVIALIPGQTYGLAWEIKEIVSKGALNRLIIILPPGNAEKRSEKWQMLRDMLRETPCGQSLDDISMDGLLAVCFPTKECPPVAIIGAASNQMDYELATLIAELQIRKAGLGASGG